MNSNIRRHIIYNIKHNAKCYVVQTLRNYGYIGSDSILLSDAMFDTYDRNGYAPIHFREFWQVHCLPVVTIIFSQQDSRYLNLKDYKMAANLANTFVIEQIERYFYW